MGVFTHEQRPGYFLHRTIITDRLRDGENVRLVERAVEGAAPMTAGAEAHSLVRITDIWNSLVISSFELTDIDQDLLGRWFSRQWMNRHGKFPSEPQLTRDR